MPPSPGVRASPPEGRRCHRGPCSYHTCHGTSSETVRFYQLFKNLIDGLVQGCSLSQRCDSHYDIARIVTGLYVLMYCVSPFESFFFFFFFAVQRVSLGEMSDN